MGRAEIVTLRTDEVQNKALLGGNALQPVRVENGEGGWDGGCHSFPIALSREKKADDIRAQEMKTVVVAHLFL